MLRPVLALVHFVLLSCFVADVVAQKNDRNAQVRDDKKRIEAEGFWIYNNMPLAFETAQKSGKPIMVVLRCLPCHECVKLDDDLVEQDPVIKSLLTKFVCARVITTNGLDLSVFQYDTDQSFAVFFLNADKTIYGRFGTRSHRTEWLGDVSITGMAAAMQGALALHAKYPSNAASLAGKRGPEPEIKSPELYPSLKEKYTSTLNYEGDVVKSCIHCHQIGDAQRELYRAKGESLPESVLFPYPHPKAIGLILDPDQRSTVKDVTANTAAAKAGFQKGDVIENLNGQPQLSIADIQWVLHHVNADGGKVTAKVTRQGQSQDLTLTLDKGWRRADDISWRVTSWGLRRMALGGMFLRDATPEERKAAEVPEGTMALAAQYVGQYGPHAAAKAAGLQKGDIIVSFDGRKDLQREADVFQLAMSKYKVGDKVAITVIRDGKKLDFSIPMQK